MDSNRREGDDGVQEQRKGIEITQTHTQAIQIAWMLCSFPWFFVLPPCCCCCCWPPSNRLSYPTSLLSCRPTRGFDTRQYEEGGKRRRDLGQKGRGREAATPCWNVCFGVNVMLLQYDEMEPVEMGALESWKWMDGTWSKLAWK